MGVMDKVKHVVLGNADENVKSADYYYGRGGGAHHEEPHHHDSHDPANAAHTGGRHEGIDSVGAGAGALGGMGAGGRGTAGIDEQQHVHTQPPSHEHAQPLTQSSSGGSIAGEQMGSVPTQPGALRRAEEELDGSKTASTTGSRGFASRAGEIDEGPALGHTAGHTNIKRDAALQGLGQPIGEHVHASSGNTAL
ncbi:hypothetical protein P7C73_g5235, partial [Tremellales sp. Uapishka_1]